MIRKEHLAAEMTYKTSRSSGPGGQNVNKVESKVTLIWNVDVSNVLSDVQKEIVKERLVNRMNAIGQLILEVSESRSQLENKQIAIDKLFLLLTNALRPTKKRIPTKVSKAKILARLDRKKQHAVKKSNRRWKPE